MQLVRDPFSRALCAIRQSVREGRYVHGQRLAITDLANQLELSATPIREALARLAGEGLIEDRRGQGYFAWRLDAVDLVELYQLQLAYLRAAAERVGLSGQALPALAPGLPPDIEALLGEVIRWGANGALIRANRLLADRLAAPRLAEATVLSGLDSELEALSRAVGLDDFLQAAGQYHARREASASAIISALRSLTPATSDIVAQ